MIHNGKATMVEHGKENKNDEKVCVCNSNECRYCTIPSNAIPMPLQLYQPVAQLPYTGLRWWCLRSMDVTVHLISYCRMYVFSSDPFATRSVALWCWWLNWWQRRYGGGNMNHETTGIVLPGWRLSIVCRLIIDVCMLKLRDCLRFWLIHRCMVCCRCGVGAFAILKK